MAALNQRRSNRRDNGMNWNEAVTGSDHEVCVKGDDIYRLRRPQTETSAARQERRRQPFLALRGSNNHSWMPVPNGLIIDRIAQARARNCGRDLGSAEIGSIRWRELVPATMSAIADAVRCAEQIMREIDDTQICGAKS
jgi:hypothetical protein